MCWELASPQSLPWTVLRLLLFCCRSVAGKALVTLLKVGAEGETTAIVASEQVSSLASQLGCLVILRSSRARLLWAQGARPSSCLPPSVCLVGLSMLSQSAGQPVPGLAPVSLQGVLPLHQFSLHMLLPYMA